MYLLTHHDWLSKTYIESYTLNIIFLKVDSVHLPQLKTLETSPESCSKMSAFKSLFFLRLQFCHSTASSPDSSITDSEETKEARFLIAGHEGRIGNFHVQIVSPVKQDESADVVTMAIIHVVMPEVTCFHQYAWGFRWDEAVTKDITAHKSWVTSLLFVFEIKEDVAVDVVQAGADHVDGVVSERQTRAHVRKWWIFWSSPSLHKLLGGLSCTPDKPCVYHCNVYTICPGSLSNS